MASEFDENDFIDSDFEASRQAYPRATPSAAGVRSPSRQELEAKVEETQDRLTRLRRAQEELERERASLEEARRRRVEYHSGREEMIQHLTRGVELLQESEFCARRDAEQMAKTLGELRDSLVKVQSLDDQSWTQDQYAVELTRALTTIENARMEWNSAQLKWPVLSKDPSEVAPRTPGTSAEREVFSLRNYSFWQLCRLGLALTWPVALPVIAGAIALILLFLRK